MSETISILFFTQVGTVGIGRRKLVLKEVKYDVEIHLGKESRSCVCVQFRQWNNL